jgi:3-phenylpropionate/trans-cinnamate dioxygenase ferredoxin subunit
VNDKKYSWHKIADSIEEISFSQEGLAQIEAGGKMICVANKEGHLAACTAKCPHAGGILANGYVDPLGNIVCPLHRYKFSLKNGRNTSGEGYFLKIFPIELREEGVFVGFEQNNFFNWLK